MPTAIVLVCLCCMVCVVAIVAMLVRPGTKFRGRVGPNRIQIEFEHNDRAR